MSLGKLANPDKAQTELPMVDMTTAFLNDIDVVIPVQNILIDFNNKLKILITHKENLEKENQKLSELKDLLLSKLAMIGEQGTDLEHSLYV